MEPLAGIREFRVANFKSYAEASLKLSALTLLVGPNASGKSNLVEGIRLLSWLAQGKRLDQVLRAVQDGELAVRGGLSDLAYDGQAVWKLGCSLASKTTGRWTDFHVQVAVTGSELRVLGESIESELERVPLYSVASPLTAGYSHDIQVEYNNFARGGMKPRIACTDQQLILTQLGTPARFGKTHTKSQKIIPQVCGAFREALSDIIFLDPAPHLMRGYSHKVDESLTETGSNLSSVLHHLCLAGQKARILDFIRALPEQDITGLSFPETPRGEVMVRLEESFAGQHEVRDAPVLSDGTLRVLAVAAALLSAREGTLVLVEEIDNGVHPSRAQRLLQNISEIAKERSLKVLLTSHNPALLDGLPMDAIPHVACCYRDPVGGDSRIVHLQDLPEAAELLARGPLGTLMTKGILERFLKAPRDPDAKARESLDWIEELAETGE